MVSSMFFAVLRTTMPLSQQASNRLYQAAFRLHSQRGHVERIQGDVMSGKVTRLGRGAAIGDVSGPAFEAEVVTEKGCARVEFVVTEEGLAKLHEEAPFLHLCRGCAAERRRN